MNSFYEEAYWADVGSMIGLREGQRRGARSRTRNKRRHRPPLMKQVLRGRSRASSHFIIPNAVALGAWFLAGDLDPDHPVADGHPSVGRWRFGLSTQLFWRTRAEGSSGGDTQMNLLILAGVGLSGCGLLSYVVAQGTFLTKFVKMGITGNDIHKPGKASDSGDGWPLGSLRVPDLLRRHHARDRLTPIIASCSRSRDHSGRRRGRGGRRLDQHEAKVQAVPHRCGCDSAHRYVLWGPSTTLRCPLIGALPVGYVFPLAVVPLAVAISANFTNMLAGFNGLEAGSAVTRPRSPDPTCRSSRSSYPATIIGVILVCGYLGFLVLNWYPAKIFPGDTGHSYGRGRNCHRLPSWLVLSSPQSVVSIPAAHRFHSEDGRQEALRGEASLRGHDRRRGRAP
jgi:hypothetical protein